MNNEIKEILDDLRKTANNSIFVVCSSQEELDKIPKYTANFLSVNDRQAKILLDYITNLQEKVNQYENPDDMTLFYMWLDTKAKDKIKQLQEENERLKEKVNDKLKHLVDLANKTDEEIEKISKLISPFVEWGECTINGKILKQIQDIINTDLSKK